MARVELIAEVSSNHGGDLSLAKEFIWRFAEAGADFVKFQTTRVKHLRRDDPQYAWFQRAELSDEAHYELKAECETAGTRFLTTVYNAAEVPFVAGLGMEAIKIGSGEATEFTLVEAVRGAPFARIFVSLGLAQPEDIACLWSGSSRYVQRVCYLRCVSRYPHPSACALGDLSCGGYSDHSAGLDGCRLAICGRAAIIEKHVQLPHQARPPKCYEATVAEFRQLRAFADDDPARFVGRWQAA